MSREAFTYLVVEDRWPRGWRTSGSAVISGAYTHRDTAQRAAGAANSRAVVVPIKLNLPNGFFTTQTVDIDVPLPDSQPLGETA